MINININNIQLSLFNFLITKISYWFVFIVLIQKLIHFTNIQNLILKKKN